MGHTWHGWHRLLCSQRRRRDDCHESYQDSAQDSAQDSNADSCVEAFDSIDLDCAMAGRCPSSGRTESSAQTGREHGDGHYRA